MPKAMSGASRSRLVVIGSGWAGLFIVQHIDTRLYDITVVSPHPTSAITPLLASAACGLLPFSCAEESIRAKNRDCNFVKAVAVSLDSSKQRVLCQATTVDANGQNDDFEIEYEYLVVCPGCRYRFPMVVILIVRIDHIRPHKYFQHSRSREACSFHEACRRCQVVTYNHL